MGVTHIPTKKLKKYQHGNEPACAGLQSQKGDEYAGNYNPDGFLLGPGSIADYRDRQQSANFRLSSQYSRFITGSFPKSSH